MASLPENVGKYDFLTGKIFYGKKDLLEKSAAIKWFWYLPLGRELKTQTENIKKQYIRLDKVCEFDKNKDYKKPTLKKYTKSNV